MYIRSPDGLGQRELSLTYGALGLFDGIGKEAELSPEVVYRLTGLVFFARYPKLRGRKIAGNLSLETEYNNIKKQVTKPSSTGNSTGFEINLRVPQDNPNPDYSKTEDQLGQLAHPGVNKRASLWDLALFDTKPRFMFATEGTVMPDGKPGSYVSMLSVTFDRPKFAVYIAKHLWDNSHDLTMHVRDRNTWRQILLLVQNHAYVHLEFYRLAAKMLEKVLQELFNRLLPLPTIKKPLAVSQKELDGYMLKLGEFLTVIVKREFWEKTCDWEKKDYPELRNKIQKMPGTFIPTGLKVDCGSNPRLPDIPLPPVPIKAK
jgi:hypothetical protein